MGSACCRVCGGCACRCRGPGVPHCNAGARRRRRDRAGRHGDARARLARRSRARAPRSPAIDHVRLLVITPAHSDHFGQARRSSSARGELDEPEPGIYARATRSPSALQRRIEVARQSGVPEESLPALRRAAQGGGSGIVGSSSPTATPSRASTILDRPPRRERRTRPRCDPSHVPLYQPDRRVLPPSTTCSVPPLYDDYGWTPDPAGNPGTRWTKIGALDACPARRVTGSPSRTSACSLSQIGILVHERLAAVATAIAPGQPRTPVDIVLDASCGEPLNAMTALVAAVGDTLLTLVHLERAGCARRIQGGTRTMGVD